MTRMKAAVEHEVMMVFAGELREDLSRIRRDLHQYPELLHDVFLTSKLDADLLESWGIEVRRNVGRHFGMGVVGTLHGTAGSDPTLLLRAGMPFRSGRRTTCLTALGMRE
ncbi:hypothetical protein MHI43_15835 [Paenibacillus sp. FSL H8-0457]|uniref:hypothetical protein n=2 Tax=unclassified Paenibacillus TaxID=185978 RepID=UPI0031015CFA